MPQRPYDRQTFEIRYFEVLEEKPEDRYVAGKRLAEENAKYSPEQISHFRAEVLLNLDKIDLQAKKEIYNIMKANQTTKSWWSATDFRRNVVSIMDIFFAAGGKKYIGES